MHILGANALMFMVFVGPWPAYSSGYVGAEHASDTFGRLYELPIEATTGVIRASISAVPIEYNASEPLGGYGGRKPMAGEGTLDPLFARAISIANGHACVTIVGGDILLMLPDLRDAIFRRVDLDRQQLYFTATHTHSGIGGYAKPFIEQQVLGKYDEVILNRLADAFALAILRSRENLEPATIDFIVADCNAEAAPVRNRMDQASEPDRTVACMTLRRVDGSIMGGMVTFAAHATCFSHRNHKASGDYPGFVQRGMSQRLGGTWLLAAGAVGSMKPLSSKPRGPQRLEEVGGKILNLTCDLVQRKSSSVSSTYISTPATDQAVLSSVVLDIDLPETQFRIGADWRLSPLLTSLIHTPRTYIQALRINDVVLMAYPADYSGELNLRLLAEVGNEGLVPVITSFNGDYIGYLIGREKYELDSYESRSMNFFGPSCGEFFHELSVRLIRRMSIASAADKCQFVKELP